MDQKKKKYLILLAIIVLFILVDQVTKLLIIDKNQEVIAGVLNFTTVQNKGGAFGVGQNSTATFVITNIVVLGIIARFMMMQEGSIDKRTYLALCFIFAGGFSNLIDRIFRGFVVDFIDFSPLVAFPVFNLADAYIFVGFVLLAIFFGVYSYKNGKKKKIGREKV